MQSGVQFTGTLGPNAQNTWFTFNWPADRHMIWNVVPVTPRQGSPELSWEVAVERASSSSCTYWITVKNLTNINVAFEGRYTILNA